MSGEKDYVDKKLNEVLSKIERLSESLLMDKINVNNEVEKYFSMTEDTIDKMTAAELSCGEYILSAYGLVIQKKLNRANVIKNWASKSLERIIAKNYKSFAEMMKYEIRKASVALNDEYAKRLSDVIMEQDAVIDELTYISQSINNLSNSLGNLARIRNKNHAYSSREN